jgi:hypothetical protein
MGNGWNGRRCWADTRVARRVGGKEDSVAIQPMINWNMEWIYRTTPLSKVLYSTGLDLLFRWFVRHGWRWSVTEVGAPVVFMSDESVIMMDMA